MHLIEKKDYFSANMTQRPLDVNFSYTSTKENKFIGFKRILFNYSIIK